MLECIHIGHLIPVNVPIWRIVTGAIPVPSTLVCPPNITCIASDDSQSFPIKRSWARPTEFLTRRPTKSSTIFMMTLTHLDLVELPPLHRSHEVAAIFSSMSSSRLLRNPAVSMVCLVLIRASHPSSVILRSTVLNRCFDQAFSGPYYRNPTSHLFFVSRLPRSARTSTRPRPLPPDGATTNDQRRNSLHPYPFIDCHGHDIGHSLRPIKPF
ncbi:hypothetical protein Hypma_002902 [Hypsizygus marmoreus]|uniref:Uncharacterized protein n=1 Tax=Hypsizygus marmoreus TaxID=39966 RepID=A0A369JAE4_HYPMA|nr:hypothetical protein Hypma_002902 [Hypsizygus marmoreus]